MARHMQRVRHGRRERGIAARRGQSLLGKRRRIVAVDEIVRDAGMIGRRNLCLFEDGRRFALVRIGLVGRQRRRVERQRVEYAGLPVIRIAQIDLLHRLLVGKAARAVIRGAPVLVECADRLDVVSLAIGFGADAARLLNRGGAGFQRRLAGRVPQWVPYAHRHAPLSHGTGGIRLANGGESLDGFGVPE